MVARSNKALQSEAGYIDARPKTRSTKLLATHGRTIHWGHSRRGSFVAIKAKRTRRPAATDKCAIFCREHPPQNECPEGLLFRCPTFKKRCETGCSTLRGNDPNDWRAARRLLSARGAWLPRSPGRGSASNRPTRPWHPDNCGHRTSDHTRPPPRPRGDRSSLRSIACATCSRVLAMTFLPTLARFSLLVSFRWPGHAGCLPSFPRALLRIHR